MIYIIVDEASVEHVSCSDTYRVIDLDCLEDGFCPLCDAHIETLTVCHSCGFDWTRPYTYRDLVNYAKSL